MDGSACIERLTYSVPEAAKALGLGKNRVYELVQERKLRAMKVTNRILIPRIEVFRFLEEATWGRP